MDTRENSERRSQKDFNKILVERQQIYTESLFLTTAML